MGSVGPGVVSVGAASVARDFLGSAGPGVVGVSVGGVARRGGSASPGVVGVEVFAGAGVVVVGKACLGMR